MSPGGDLAVVIPARNESDRIGATVEAATRIAGADVIVVVDDGSHDGTGSAAAAAGAIVVRHARNRGKAAALESGAEAVRVIEAERSAAARSSPAPGQTSAPGQAWAPGQAADAGQASAPGQALAPGQAADAGQPLAPGQALATGQALAPGQTAEPGQAAAAGAARHLLFLDADLGETAAQAGPLADPVRAGTADMTIAVFAERVKLGGHGLVLGLAGAGIERATGWRPSEPLNGQRCLTRQAFEAARPLAVGWGAETGMTIDLLRQGFRITEVRVPLTHRATGKDLGAQVHRARQLLGVARALAARQPWRHRPAGPPAAQASEEVEAA
jgi:Glycosyl transferase family 2